MGRNLRTTYHFDMDPPMIARASIHSVPFYCGICAILALCSLYGFVYLIDDALPTPLMVNDERSNPGAFIAERAIWTLKNLTDMGPRITGSHINEYLAVEYLKSQINLIIEQANESQMLKLDVQLVSGAYYLDAHASGAINSYHDVQNVIVKLHGRDVTQHSILVNSHFDSVPTSPGGSDDGINVAAMLEILRVLSTSSSKPSNNVIFLFNGAEETPLQAAHGFITQHKWAKHCKAVINLEAAGAGGKIILFQTGPETPWLTKYYAMVPYPYGQVAGEEIFQSGIIPSDTDFRIFRDFGGLVGLDMAFFKNGYRYHTKYDDFSHIPHGSYQHVGANALSLVKNLADAPELSQSAPGKAVYFDIFTWFLVSYTNSAGVIINVAIVVLSVGVFVYSIRSIHFGLTKSTCKYIGLVLGATILSWLVAGTSVLIIALVLDLAAKTMSWYGNPWLIFGLYVVPTLALSGCLLFFTNHENLSLNIRCQIQAHAVRLIWTVILFSMVCFNVRSAYALMVPVLFNSLGFVVIYCCRWQYTVTKWRLAYLVSLLVPTMLLMYQASTTLALFIPITGRMGSNRNPELITILTNSLRHAKYYFIILAATFAIFFIVVFTPLGFPYSGDSDWPRPQRHWILHTSRRFHNESGDIVDSDAGYFFLNLDRNSPGVLTNYVKELSEAQSVAKRCDQYIMCGLPLGHAKMMEIMQYSTWIPSAQPNLAVPMEFSFEKEILTSTKIRYNLTISGPDRFTLYLAPKESVTVTNLSLVDEVKPSAATFKHRPVYFVLYQRGKGGNNFSFTLDVEVPGNWNGTAMDIAVTCRYVHEDTMNRTPEFKTFLSQFPEWADLTAWVAAYYTYII
ncbi:endoplasmic reticulum metallopeptidase 1-like isoform X2 [Cylas formicarius]|uniref:endoplasmic reticulum metallopeptidase 1-like isoform X2 n=1 Tax=Cylas formicarius TaxID=197179 RepID=UPI002958D038|nr:endoplasmic reticulum metallopeptidase 1-like isoform X2 [Cylas formicarius]